MKDFIKTNWLFSIIVFICTLFLIQPLSVEAKDLDVKAESTILVDVETGKILYAKNPDKPLPPASMTKIMTEYLVWEAIETGEISWDSTTQISDYVYDISANNEFSGIGLRKDVDYTVRSLYEAMAIYSDNAATIALAEVVAGSESEFVKLMNEKGEEMGLPDFKYVNSTGLNNKSLGDNYPEGTKPDDNNLISARSIAILAYNLVTEYPEALEISSMTETKFDGEEIRNWNWMLPHDASFLKPYFYEGVDGLKTGNTTEAGYSFTGTASRNGERLISVVMKTKSEDARFKETAKLFDYGFSKFEKVELFPKGYQLKEQTTLPVAKGKDKQVGIALKEAIVLPIKKGDEDKYQIKYKYDEKLLNEDGELSAPIKKGEKVGVAELTFDEDYGYLFENSEKTVDIVTTEAIEKKNSFSLALSAIGEFFVKLFTTIIDFFKGLF